MKEDEGRNVNDYGVSRMTTNSTRQKWTSLKHLYFPMTGRQTNLSNRYPQLKTIGQQDRSKYPLKSLYFVDTTTEVVQVAIGSPRH